MSYSKIMNKARILQFIQRPTIKQKCNFSRLITSNSLTLNKSCSFQKVAEIRSVIATNIAFVRYNSNESDQSVERIEVTDDVIPEPPEVPNEVVEPVEKVLNVLGEETLESAGLGSWTPVGILQNALQYMHVSFDMPWWLTIIAGTAILRLLVFPLVISSQRHTIKMNNNMPKIQEYQQKISECRLQGNPYEMARASQELMLFMKSNHVNPIKGMILPAIQFPIFLSMFLGLRGMAMLPLESLTYGGLWWFTDLTLPDQFFILPIVTVATLGLTIELGADIGKLTSSGVGFGKYLKYGLRLLPLAIFPFIMNFPCAVCLYWASTNFISLTQVMFLRIPKVRKYFNIEEKKKFEKPKTKKGLIGDFKDSWKNMQVVREIEERERLDHMKFTQAGRAPPVKTYKYNPTVAGGLKQEKQ
ncbi:mitochondrial inner membrane protein OXA1L-like isoform X1 [Daktulosphaira vitifoliae]|uniref:mitochondrial inner membrane protein OXA1L-like isoform X1 n=1 Tax=Daktulosphaira vitifoliae TaxID=58002 RepID=UPI0021AAA2C0|nr:mitochondrial inner membrane protein OXA1L-like isoform X1 [Daktulosphaira vitifoliae]